MGTLPQQGQLIGDAIVAAVHGEPLPVAIPTPADSASVFERLAMSGAPVENLERLMAMWERGEARKAENAFNAAMSEAQSEMRPIAADATNPQTRSRYASYEALDKALRPIYTRHGFGLSFNTGETTLEEHVRVLCKATHRGGHSELYHIDMPADGKGARGGDVMTKTHAVGSAVSYGMRYLLKMIFNVAVGEDDDDGNRASGKQEKKGPVAPQGYDAWFANLEGIADSGAKAFDDAWQKSSLEFRKHLAETAPKMLAGLKTRAARAGK